MTSSSDEKEWNKLTLEIFSKLEKDWIDNLWTPTTTTTTTTAFSPSPTTTASYAASATTTRILTIDGGGLKPIVAAQALIHLESLLQLHSNNPDARIADFFDVVAGTGLGGVLAALVLADNGSGRPMYSAAEAAEIVIDNAGKLFKKRMGGLFGGGGFSGGSAGRVLKSALSRHDMLLTLRDTLKPVLIPCYDLRSGAPVMFSRAAATESASFDFELWRVCRATSAAPPGFKPVELSSTDGRTSYTAVDGGLVMNNPAAAAVTHVLHNKMEFPAVRGVEDLMVLSLGNGPLEWLGRGSEIPRWSTRSFSDQMVEVVLDGVSDTVDQILGNVFASCHHNYLRIQASAMLGDAKGNGRGRRSAKRTAKAFMEAGKKMLKSKAMESLPFGGKRLASQTNAECLECFATIVVAAGKRLPMSSRRSSDVS